MKIMKPLWETNASTGLEPSKNSSSSILRVAGSSSKLALRKSNGSPSQKP